MVSESQPVPTNLRTYLANSKFAAAVPAFVTAAVPAFVTATPTSAPTSKSQLWRSQGRGEVISKPMAISAPEGTLQKSLSTSSLLELSMT